MENELEKMRPNTKFKMQITMSCTILILNWIYSKKPEKCLVRGTLCEIRLGIMRRKSWIAHGREMCCSAVI